MKKIYSLSLLAISFSAYSQNVGVGTSNPQQKLEVAGWIELGNESEGTSGTAGTIRYQTTGKIQFYNGTLWIDLLSANNSGDYIKNQNSAAQSANFWISGNGQMDGALTVGSNATITGNNIYGTSVGDVIFSLNSRGGIRMKLDVNNNGSEDFAVQNGGGTNVFTITESGAFTANSNGTIDGDLSLTGASRTFSAGDALDISGSSGIDIILDNNNDGTSSSLDIKNNGTSNVLFSIPEDNRPTSYPYGTSAGNTGGIRFRELAANGSNYIGLKVPDAIGSDYTFTLPGTDGGSNQVLITNGSGTLSWASAFSVIGSDADANDGLTVSYPDVDLNVNNGLSLNSDNVQLGGTLIQATTITQGSFNMTYNLDGSGDFDIQDAGASAFFVKDDAKVGLGTNNPSAKLNLVGAENTTLTAFTQAVSSAGILITPAYTASAYTPGVFWSTSSNNPTKPKAGIWLLEDGSGTDMYFGTSNSYATGITNNGLVLDQSGNTGIGTITPGEKLEVYGNTLISGDLYINGSLTNTSASVHYGTYGRYGQTVSGYYVNPSGQSANGLWFEATHDGESGGIFMNGNSISMWSAGDNDILKIYDEDNFTTTALPTPKLIINGSGNVGIGIASPAVLLSVGGNGSNVYNTSAWIENNLHVQGNETLTQGGRGRLRVGTAWNYIGLYSEGSSTSVNNDLVLGASSGIVRVGPYSGAGQSLRWANSLLVDDQGGSIELGGTNSVYTGGTPYIDFHCNSGYTRDYDTRLMASVDAYGPIISMYSYKGTTNYRYLDLDWIGAYDNWADVSAWRYWANDWDDLWDDLHNDLDLIDGIKPQRRIDPKTGKEVITNDPATVPPFLMTQAIDNPNSFKYDINRVSWFSIGAIRQLRQETKTKDEDLENRVARLETLLADLAGKKLDKIPFVGKQSIYRSLSNYVVIDPRIKANDNVVVSFENDFAPSYKLKDIRDGSFEIVFEKPLEESLNVSYTTQ